MTAPQVSSNVIRNYSFITGGLTHCPREWHVDEKKAPGFHRFYFIQDGRAWYEDPLGKFVLRKDHAYLLPSHLPYANRHFPEQHLSLVWFHAAAFPPVCSNLLEIPVSHDSLYSALIESYVQCMKSSSTSATILPNIINAIFEAMLVSTNIETITDNRIVRVISCIHNQYHIKLTDTMLAGIAGLDRWYLARLFKKLTGMSVHQYTAQYRLQIAKGLISRGEKISSSAEASGFSDPKVFSRFFKASTGMTPLAYSRLPHQA